jgi:hypothetical protein
MHDSIFATKSNISGTFLIFLSKMPAIVIQKASAEAKIDKFDMTQGEITTFADEHILRFYIVMDESVRVQLLKAIQELNAYLAHSF